jgi:chemotaxis protein MotA
MNEKLDLATVAGIVAGVGLLVGAILMGGSLGMFLDVPSMLIVIGGTAAATLINFPMFEVMGVIRVMPRAFRASYTEPTQIMKQIIHLCGEAKKQGVLGLETHAKNIDNRFFQTAVGMVVDGLDADHVTSTLKLQNLTIKERHKTGRAVLEGAGTWAPAFGMIGTLIGLVQMMANMADPSQIGPKMAIALLTTFYGAVLANLIFLPMAGKLKRLTEIEVVTNAIIIEGVVGIQKGAAPTVLEGRLKSYLETGRQSEKIKAEPAAPTVEGAA